MRILLLTAFLLGGGGLSAQVGPAERILKERARGVTNDVSQRSGNPNYTPPAKGRPAAPPAAAPAAVRLPELTEAQRKAARQLRQDLEAVAAGKEKTPTQTLTQDLLQAASGPRAPGLNALMAVASDLAAVWGAQKWTGAQQEAFVEGVIHLLNSDLPPAAAQLALRQAEALLEKSGAPGAEARRLAGSLKQLNQGR
ncbi:MAG: hypothetical protein N3J91_12800 [Verrucomicrobiae bacterium]|nr:hypothetical protein [Verrucomicrobiae bacterium]